MLRACRRAGLAAAKQNSRCVRASLRPSRLHRGYATHSGESGVSVGKVIGAGLLLVGGGIGGTVLYASYDKQFRESVEKAIPYSDKLFEMALGPAPSSTPVPKKPIHQGPLKISSVAEVMKESKQPASKSQLGKPEVAAPTEEKGGNRLLEIITSISN
ncbi:hypothetical protein DUI87_09551 [Hirundo rustica rustica]|uniref:MICOS complex subunit MIC60 n=1 Tax=Hirundo rustica rustica TaxID=333673 RepID=A0A3M0KMX4_HIRRU|nr:hypothetical protein DUI87_09551 [Hirundo rustica rustica]